MKTNPNLTSDEANLRSPSETKKTLWAGRVMSAIPGLFLLMDSIMKFMKPAVVVQTTLQLGYPESAILGLGVILLASIVLYIIPRTTVLGAILLTGYLGGAVATHVRVGNPLLGYVLFPVYLGTLIWGGLFLRDIRVRALIPLQAKR